MKGRASGSGSMYRVPWRELRSGTIGFEDEPEAEGKSKLKRSRQYFLSVGWRFYGQEKECRGGGPTDR